VCFEEIDVREDQNTKGPNTWKYQRHYDLNWIG
jgi:hypothetical protein